MCLGGPLPDKDIVINLSTDLDVDSMISVVESDTDASVARGTNDNVPPPTFIKNGLKIADVGLH